MKSQIGVVQMKSTNNVEDNLTFAKSKIMQASSEGIDLIAFPETFIYVGRDHQEKHKAAQTLDGLVVHMLRDG
jgi:predicted amidohydrolase